MGRCKGRAEVAGERVAGDAGELAWLDDLVVIDLGDEATALAGALLAELGALVIRVEDGAGDSLRGPDASYVNLTSNAGKVSFAVDFDDPATWAPVLDRAGSIDVAIGPLGPSHPARALESALGAAGVPLVRTVFRRSAPTEVATDLTVMAAGGHLVLNGGPDDPPAHPAGDLGFKQTSLAAAEAALALALASRTAPSPGLTEPQGRDGVDGPASQIEVSAQEAVALTTFQTANGNIWHWHQRAPGRDPKNTDGTTVRSRDGKWTSCTVHGPNWAGFVSWVGEVLGPRGIEGPEWADSEHAVANRAVLYAVVAEMAAALTQAELIEQGQAHGHLILPVQDFAAVANDEHLVARDFFETVPAANTVGGATARIAGSAFRSNVGRGRRGPAPALGEGGAQALGRLASSDRSRSQGPGSAAKPSSAGEVDPHQPLAGVRIVDFCWAIAGTTTTRLLASLGAEVIKIESENGLDMIRYVGVQPDGGASWDTNGIFQETSANKKAVTINVNTAEGQALVKRLIATADVVTANYTPDRMTRWGLGSADLEAVKADIITVNMAVMGTFGPNKDWRSYGSGIVALCGLAAHSGQPERLPECLGPLHTDFTVPYFAALQIMAALHQRQRTGCGAHIELSQYETAVRLVDAELAAVLNGEPVPARNGNRSAVMAPHGVYPSAGDDRWLAVSCRDDDDWRQLVDVVDGLSGLDRWTDQGAVDDALAAWSSGLDNWEAAALLQKLGVPSSPVEDLSDLHGQDPSMPTVWKHFDLPAGLSAVVLQEPVLWDGKRLPLRRAPTWYEHTYEVLVEDFGLGVDEFADLVERQVLW